MPRSTSLKSSRCCRRCRRAESPWVDPADARKPQEGDQVTLDIEIKDGEEEFNPKSEDSVFVIGESNLLAELRDVILTLDIGESGSADILFGEDDDRYREDDPRRGKTMTYTVTLKGIKERDLLPLDDEFAATYGSNVETLEALRNQLRTNLHVQKTREARTTAVTTITEQLNSLAEFDIPVSMIDDAVTERINNVKSPVAVQRGSSGGLPPSNWSNRRQLAGGRSRPGGCRSANLPDHARDCQARERFSD